jgi:uncharacterized protein (DUF427 family)
MSLTMGSAPLGPRPAGVFNFERGGPAHALYLEPSPRSVRGLLGSETVVDSRRAKLLHETGHLPIYYFPRSDVRFDLLEPTDHSTHCPFKGDARYWTVRAGDAVAENAVWGYEDPIEGAPPIADHVAFYWDRIDRWFEEDEEVFVHPRDPYHRVDVLPTSRHVRVGIGDDVLAETTRAQMLLESNLPPRWYIPRADVRMDMLTAVETTTACPYKGAATYWSASAGGEEHPVLAWTYEEPLAEVGRIAGLVCFFDERVDLDVDGERQERPQTPWASADWATAAR